MHVTEEDVEMRLAVPKRDDDCHLQREKMALILTSYRRGGGSKTSKEIPYNYVLQNQDTFERKLWTSTFKWYVSVIERERERERQIKTQTETERDRERERQTDRQTDRD